MIVKAKIAFGFERDGKVVPVRAGEEIDVPDVLADRLMSRGFLAEPKADPETVPNAIPDSVGD